MKFLDDYPTLEKLEAAYPGITASTDKIQLTETNRPYALSAVALQYRARLERKYSQGELLFGLRILFGVGKGSNRRYMVLRNGIILKYGVHGTTEPSRPLQQRIARCVTMARNMAYKAWLATQFSAASDLNALIRISYPDVIKSALGYHFRIAGASAGIGRVTETYKKVYAGLSSHVIIADGRRSTIGGGCVPWDLIYQDPKDTIPSPFRTSAVRWKEDAALIAQLKALPADQIAATARARGVAPTIEALVMRRSGSIHIPFKDAEDRSRWTDLGIATIILHEASHKFGATEDYAYNYEDSKYLALDSRLRIWNADSYAYAAASLYNDRLIKNRKDTALAS